MRPSIEHLRDALGYDPATGKLIWQERTLVAPGQKMALSEWNARFAGREAFTHLDAAGYLQGCVLGYSTRAHRAIWAIVTGEWPIEVDHDNGDGSDNRWANLLNGTHADNMKNMRLHSTNKSGVAGVFRHSDGVRWCAQIWRDGKPCHIGLFDTLEAATGARRAEERQLGYNANHGRLICSTCERRADDPAVKSCTHTDCGLVERRAA